MNEMMERCREVDVEVRCHRKRGHEGRHRAWGDALVEWITPVDTVEWIEPEVVGGQTRDLRSYRCPKFSEGEQCWSPLGHKGPHGVGRFSDANEIRVWS